jgi:hypothetical protein
MKTVNEGFDVAPFRFPDSPPHEARFEEARDVEVVEAAFTGPVPRTACLQYLRKVWPHERVERAADMDLVRPSQFGWLKMDDQFTPEWADAATRVTRVGARTLRFTFQPLRMEIPEFPDAAQYDGGN